MYCKSDMSKLISIDEISINSSKVYCKLETRQIMLARGIVLIVAKCIVNFWKKLLGI